MAVLVKNTDFPDTSISFYDSGGNFLLCDVAHACLLSRALSLRSKLENHSRKRRLSSEPMGETFSAKKMNQFAFDSEAKLHPIRIDVADDGHGTTIDMLRTFLQCFYVDLSPDAIDPRVLEKITQHLVQLYELASRYCFADLASVCLDAAARFMTRDMCEGILTHFIDASTGSVREIGIDLVTTCVTWARQCTNGWYWRTILLEQLTQALTEDTMARCDITRPSPEKIVLRKCQRCWSVSDTPSPYVIIPDIPVKIGNSNARVSIVWTQLHTGGNHISITSRTAVADFAWCVTDFHRSGLWPSQTKVVSGNTHGMVLAGHDTNRLFYAGCMNCNERSPCYIYTLTFICDETELSISMD